MIQPILRTGPLSEHETFGAPRWFRNDDRICGVSVRNTTEQELPFRMKEVGVPSRLAPVRPWLDHVHRISGRIGSRAQDLRARLGSMSLANRRIGATATLLAVTASAALAFSLPPQNGKKPSPPVASAAANVESSTTPVKIVGAAPRSENCAEQVWPYIERRCLTRADPR